MRIIYGYDYGKRNDANVLVRVYDSRVKPVVEKEQCLGEILFRPDIPHEPARFTAWLPRGIANAVVTELAQLELDPRQGNFVVGIANEFPQAVGVLTSCADNFKAALRVEAQRVALKTQIEGLN